MVIMLGHLEENAGNVTNQLHPWSEPVEIIRQDQKVRRRGRYRCCGACHTIPVSALEREKLEQHSRETKAVLHSS